MYISASSVGAVVFRHFFNHTPLYTSGNRENTVCCVHLSLGFVCTPKAFVRVLWTSAIDFFNHTLLYTSGNRENTICCVHLSLGFVCTRRRSSGCCGLRPPIFVQSHSLVHLRQYQLPGPGPATASPRMDAQSITSAYGAYGAEVARLTPDHKVGSSNHFALTILSPQRSDCNRATSRQ